MSSGGGPISRGPQEASAVPQENPVLKWYNDWSSRTPLITRSTLQMLIILWILTWVVDLSQFVLNIPFFTLFRFQVYRIVLAPLYTDSILSVLFIALSLSGIAPTLEQSMGSTGLAFLMISLSLITNTIFLVVCLLMYVVGISSALFWMAGSFWLIVLGLITVECLLGPFPTRQFFMLPMQLPSKYYPLFLFVLFSLFTGPRLDMACSVGVGYLYGLGLVKWLQPSEETLQRWETSRLLTGLVNKPGYISVTSATGSQAWLPTTMPPAAASATNNSGGRPVGSNPPTIYSMTGGGSSTSSGASAAASNSMSSSAAFSGGGHTLGGGGSRSSGAAAGGNKRDIAEARAAKLTALAQGGAMATLGNEETEEETATLLQR